jgi:uncharacterized protein
MAEGQTRIYSGEVITYSLRGGEKCSCGFYRDAAALTDEIVAEGEKQFGPLLDGFLVYLEGNAREAARTRPEYLFELLTLGVLWHVYGQAAVNLSGLLVRLLSWLAELRERNPRLKKTADLGRGLFAARLRPPHLSVKAPTPLSSVADIERLLRWMQAAGRFTQEIRRLRGWMEFFTTCPADTVRTDLSVISAYADWFAKRSLYALGVYTCQVEQFLSETQPGYRWREDYILCGRQQVEYHLNMVGMKSSTGRCGLTSRIQQRKFCLCHPACAPSQMMFARQSPRVLDIVARHVRLPAGYTS